MKKYSFPPIANNESRVLILGTMPGDRSLKTNEYYAHRRNQFWKILFSICSVEFTENYEKRKIMLLENKIAVWDVLMHCEREGSSDSEIKGEQPNDFGSFFSEHKSIRTVFFSSLKARDLFFKYVEIDNSLKFIVLPSTSSANTWKTFDEKLREWNEIFVYLDR